MINLDNKKKNLCWWKVYCWPAALLLSFKLNDNATLLHDANVSPRDSQASSYPVTVSWPISWVESLDFLLFAKTFCPSNPAVKEPASNNVVAKMVTT